SALPTSNSCSTSSARASNRPTATSCSNSPSQMSASNRANQERSAASSAGVRSRMAASMASTFARPAIGPLPLRITRNPGPWAAQRAENCFVSPIGGRRDSPPSGNLWVRRDASRSLLACPSDRLKEEPLSPCMDDFYLAAAAHLKTDPIGVRLDDHELLQGEL